MSDIARRLAEACERAAAVLNAHAEANATSSRGAAMAADVSDIRALAAGLRGAERIGAKEHEPGVVMCDIPARCMDVDANNFVITLGDA